MLVGGQPTRTHQFGAVATRESERGKGLSRILMNHVLGKYPDVPAFLGANDSVLDFYPRFGFRPVQTYRPVIDAVINNPAGGIKCSPDDEHVHRALYGERVRSSLLDSINTQPVTICQMLTNPKYKDCIWFLPKCEALVVAKKKDNVLFLSDVATSKPLAFEALVKELPFTGITCVEFGFYPDWLGVNPK